jgi:hypothetical protein
MVVRASLQMLAVAVLTAVLVGCGGGSEPITKIEMARSVAPDGSAVSPTAAFDSNSDQSIIAVLKLADLAPGTEISYTRYRDGKYVNAKTAKLKKKSKYFHFKFKPKGGGSFTPGSYRLKFYVNEKSAGETSFTIK